MELISCCMGGCAAAAGCCRRWRKRSRAGNRGATCSLTSSRSSLTSSLATTATRQHVTGARREVTTGGGNVLQQGMRACRLGCLCFVWRWILGSHGMAYYAWPRSCHCNAYGFGQGGTCKCCGGRKAAAGLGQHIYSITSWDCDEHGDAASANCTASILFVSLLILALFSAAGTLDVQACRWHEMTQVYVTHAGASLHTHAKGREHAFLLCCAMQHQHVGIHVLS
jgi:hypothetical protein